MADNDPSTLVADLSRANLSPLPDPLKSLLFQAILEDATDIHIHTYQNQICIFFRVDGTIYRKQCLFQDQGKQLLNQIRSAAKLGVSQIFRPEEGQIRCREDGVDRDIRVTLIPVGKETAAHMRFLSIPDTTMNLTDLGLSRDNRDCIEQVLKTHQGLILVTGTTGSGKTTTLYSVASRLKTQEAAIYSIEDPVEFRLPFAQQMEVNEAQGLTMHEGLRTILRMDPDAIVIGEIRDPESAVTAARAALSGQLVIATIHGRDTLGALEAFHYLSVPRYVIAGSTRLVIAQQLVRLLCPDCRELRTPTQEELDLFHHYEVSPPDQIPHATGCENCNGYGYKGRTGIFEILPLELDMANKISGGVPFRHLEQQSNRRPQYHLIQGALSLVAEHMTSLEEIFEIVSLHHKRE